jgi:hypothetical protein
MLGLLSVEESFFCPLFRQLILFYQLFDLLVAGPHDERAGRDVYHKQSSISICSLGEGELLLITQLIQESTANCSKVMYKSAPRDLRRITIHK